MSNLYHLSKLEEGEFSHSRSWLQGLFLPCNIDFSRTCYCLANFSHSYFQDTICAYLSPNVAGSLIKCKRLTVISDFTSYFCFASLPHLSQVTWYGRKSMDYGLRELNPRCAVYMFVTLWKLLNLTEFFPIKGVRLPTV